MTEALATKAQQQYIYDMTGRTDLPSDLTKSAAGVWIEELLRAKRTGGEVPSNLMTAPGEKPAQQPISQSARADSEAGTRKGPGGLPSTAVGNDARSISLSSSDATRADTPVQRAIAPASNEPPEFVTADRFATALLIRPEIGIEQMSRIYEQYKAFRSFILSDPNCYDEIEGSKEMNRTGSTRLSVAFGLNIEERSLDEKPFEDDVRFISRVRVSKGSRYVDGLGTSRLSEIPEKTKKGTPVPIGQREHFAATRAVTRATKRGIADLLGGTETE